MRSDETTCRLPLHGRSVDANSVVERKAMARYLTVAWGTAATSVVLCVPVHGQEQEQVKFTTIYAAEGHHEYAKDGSATLGFIAQRLPAGKVKFTMCDSKTVEVLFADLRPSKAKCESKPRVPGIWQANQLTPIYKDAADTSNTKVVFGKQVVDLKTFKSWHSLGIALPQVKAGEPVGFAFKDSDGANAMAILRSGSAQQDGSLK